MANDDDRATTCRRSFKAPWLQTERTKNEGPSEKKSFNGEAVWGFQTKKIKKSTPPMENKPKEQQDPRGKTWTWTHASRRKETEAKMKQSFRINCWNSARLELKSQVLTCSTFCKLAWSWHDQWRWQGYHVHAQFQISIITNRTYTKWRAFWKNEF